MEISGEYHGLGYITNNLIYPICYGDTPKMDGFMENTIFQWMICRYFQWIGHLHMVYIYVYMLNQSGF